MYFRLITVTLLVCLAAVSSAGKTPGSNAELHAQLEGANLDNTDHAKAVFAAWQARHNIVFKDDAESNAAFLNFVQKAKEIQQHRVEHKAGKHSHNLGLNHMSHLSWDTIKATRLGLKSTTANRKKRAAGGSMRSKRALAVSLDYSATGYTTPVKDQGICGCCWTFATTGGLEGAYFKKTKKLLSFSEQQLVECVAGFVGCDGGAAAAGVLYVQSNAGLALETTYPYTSGNGAYNPCTSSSMAMVSLNPSYVDVPSDDLSLMTALNTYGPIPATVSVNAQFMSYTSGVMNPATSCDVTNNHAILVVGYGKDPTTGQNFWKIKNSWSTAWGENGYLRLSRDVPNSCGVSVEPIGVQLY